MARRIRSISNSNTRLPVTLLNPVIFPSFLPPVHRHLISEPAYPLPPQWQCNSLLSPPPQPNSLQPVTQVLPPNHPLSFLLNIYNSVRVPLRPERDRERVNSASLVLMREIINPPLKRRLLLRENLPRSKLGIQRIFLLRLKLSLLLLHPLANRSRFWRRRKLLPSKRRLMIL